MVIKTTSFEEGLASLYAILSICCHVGRLVIVQGLVSGIIVMSFGYAPRERTIAPGPLTAKTIMLNARYNPALVEASPYRKQQTPGTSGISDGSTPQQMTHPPSRKIPSSCVEKANAEASGFTGCIKIPVGLLPLQELLNVFTMLAANAGGSNSYDLESTNGREFSHTTTTSGIRETNQIILALNLFVMNEHANACATARLIANNKSLRKL